MTLDYFYGQSGELFSYFRRKHCSKTAASGSSPPMPGRCTASYWTA